MERDRREGETVIRYPRRQRRQNPKVPMAAASLSSHSGAPIWTSRFIVCTFREMVPSALRNEFAGFGHDSLRN